MPSPNLGMLQGSFTSDGNVRQINLPFRPTRFDLFNETAWPSTDNPGVMKRSWWFEGFADEAALIVQNTNGAATDQSAALTANGFTFIDPTTLGAPLVDTAVTGITAATPAAVTMSTDHGLVTGDLVVFANTTGMLQITNQVWQVTSTGATTYTITAPGATFAAPATSGTVRRAFASEYQPSKVFVQGISQATSAVVTTTFDHGYSVDENVTMHIPEFWGMTEMDGLQGRITAVTANTFTIDINSSAFTAFTYPTSAQASAGVGTAHAVNIGIEQSNLLTDSIVNTSRFSMRLGSSLVGVNNDVLFWTAWSAEGNNIVV